MEVNQNNYSYIQKYGAEFCKIVEESIEKYKMSFAKFNYNPQTMVNDWQEFVDICGGGYMESVMDYDYDLRIRDDIEQVLKDNNLYKHEGFSLFRSEIEAIDISFKELLHSEFKRNATTWWQQGILKYGGEEYVSSVSDLLGYKIESV